MEFKLGDSRTWQPFRKNRSSKKHQAAQQASLLQRLFERLGWVPKPDLPSNMKEVVIVVPCIAGGQPRKLGETVVLSNDAAAELISMKVAALSPHQGSQRTNKPVSHEI